MPTHELDHSPNFARSPATIQCVARLRNARRGNVLVLVLILLPALIGVVGLLLDGSILLNDSRELQHATDAAATAAALERHNEGSAADLTAVTESYIQQHNQFAAASVDVFAPPVQGPYAGVDGFVEVVSTRQTETYLIHVLGQSSSQTLVTRAVAGARDATAGAAIVVLDPDPPPFNLLGLSLPLVLPSLPALLGGLECLGAGRVQVHGAVLVNTEWGGVDEEGQPAGLSAGPPHAIHCMPLLPLTKLSATDIRVVGGVDNERNYGATNGQSTDTLRCNKRSVPDPLRDVPPPTVATDPANVSATQRGHVTIVGLPILLPPVVLNPGVYESINVVSGRVVFNPGVYIIRNRNALTQLPLSIVAGQVVANGVMFYLTDNASYSAAGGSADALDGESTPAPINVGGLLPSAVINVGLLSSQFSPLDSPGSPYHGMMIYQRRHDRRPIVIVQENLLGAGTLQGTVYSKWGHLILAGKGTYNARFVVGTMRIVALLDVTIQPNQLLPPAQDVFLVE